MVLLRKSKGLLNREKLLEKQDLEIVKVDLGDDVHVFVRQMTGHERDEFEGSLVNRFKDAKGKFDYDMKLEDFRAKLAVHTVCDDKGVLFLQSNDYKRLSTNMSALRLEKIINESQRINAITEEDKEELVKNSDAGQAGSSSSDSVES